ncbi:hypothetical protein TI05_03785 [Achromatium sp. WMS3]|nr:hypothetical protein TI05_03785 [Achromatium sp. WMS3]
MNIQELLTLYQIIAAKHNLPKFAPQTVGLHIESEYLNSPHKVMATLETMQPISGWLSFQSCNYILHAGKKLPTMTDATGVLLNAELVNNTGVALQIRYYSSGSWLITKFTETPHGNYLKDTLKFVVQGSSEDYWHYKRFWHIDLEQGILPYAACLAR